MDTGLASDAVAHKPWWKQVNSAFELMRKAPGTGNRFQASRVDWTRAMRRNIMPVILLWGIPAIIFVGGVGYFLVHATH
jgi:hypothetical protein